MYRFTVIAVSVIVTLVVAACADQYDADRVDAQIDAAVSTFEASLATPVTPRAADIFPTPLPTSTPVTFPPTPTQITFPASPTPIAFEAKYFEDELELKTLRIVDENGRARIELSATADGSHLKIFDAVGNVVITMQDLSGVPFFDLSDSKGEIFMTVVGGISILNVGADTGGSVTITNQISGAGTPAVFLKDNGDESRIIMQLTGPSEVPVFIMMDES